MHDYNPPEDLLKERIILVTGAGDGIGKAAACACAQHGATVILLGRTVTKLEAVYDIIENSGGPQPAIIPMDFSAARAGDYGHVAEVIDQEYGRLDGLLHNAAELGKLAPIEHYDPEVWARVMLVNLHAPFMLTRACLSLLKRSKDASVVFTSADVGRKGRAYWGAYGAACFAVEGLMQILADELQTNTPIRVNSIDPGPVRTGMRARAYPGEDAGRLPMPNDIMAAYLYLLGPDSRGVSGKAVSAQNGREYPGKQG